MEPIYLPLNDIKDIDTAILVGDKKRVNLFSNYLEKVKIIGSRREFHIREGSFNGYNFLIVSIGIGAPSAAIAIEELRMKGIEVIVRVGTALGVGVDIGSIVIAKEVIVEDGTSLTYGISKGDIVSTSPELLKSITHERDILPVRFLSSDGFYSQIWKKNFIESIKKVKVKALDMETSTILGVGTKLKMTTSSVCAITVNEYHEFLSLQEREELENRLIKFSLNGISGYLSTYKK